MAGFDHQSGKYFSLGDARIYYETAGDQNKPVLVLLHGGLGDMEDFNPILSNLTDKCYVIGVDSRGQGKSTLGKEILTYERMQHDVEALLKSLHLERVNVLGLSDGATVAFRMAASGTITIDKLAAVGGTWTINDIFSIKDLFQKITPENWKEKFPDAVNKYERLNPEADFSLLTASVKRMWLDPSTAGHPNHNVHAITCPTLLVRGDHDHLVSLKSTTELKEHIKNSYLLNIPFAGHVAFQDQPEIFIRVFKQFISR